MSVEMGGYPEMNRGRFRSPRRALNDFTQSGCKRESRGLHCPFNGPHNNRMSHCHSSRPAPAGRSSHRASHTTEACGRPLPPTSACGKNSSPAALAASQSASSRKPVRPIQMKKRRLKVGYSTACFLFHPRSQYALLKDIPFWAGSQR